MKLSILFKLLSFVGIVSLIYGCDKYHAKNLSGKYYCKVHHQSWNMTSSNIDTVYYEYLDIKQDGEYVVVLGTPIHIDSLWKEKEYNIGSYQNYMKVRFKNDQVFITTSGGGLAGNTSYYYEGVKE